ncbi:hypothetical protein [Neptuniibacter sp. QD37_11]|uniref:hypothetical protein n=1 Tax=Neptuniibacter sp. QD37_11 TaxID=3398209 RepID=UPI0039F4B82B
MKRTTIKHTCTAVLLAFAIIGISLILTGQPVAGCCTMLGGIAIQAYLSQLLHKRRWKPEEYEATRLALTTFVMEYSNKPYMTPCTIQQLAQRFKVCRTDVIDMTRDSHLSFVVWDEVQNMALAPAIIIGLNCEYAKNCRILYLPDPKAENTELDVQSELSMKHPLSC